MSSGTKAKIFAAGWTPWICDGNEGWGLCQGATGSLTSSGQHFRDVRIYARINSSL